MNCGERVAVVIDGNAKAAATCKGQGSDARRVARRLLRAGEHGVVANRTQEHEVVSAASNVIQGITNALHENVVDTAGQKFAHSEEVGGVRAGEVVGSESEEILVVPRRSVVVRSIGLKLNSYRSSVVVHSTFYLAIGVIIVAEAAE